MIKAGQQITEGSISPQELLHILGKEAVQTFLVDEVQKVYRSQGVDINDKHIEVIVRQMMRKVRIDSAGDTGLLPGEIVSQWEYEEANARALAEGGEPATAQTVLLGLIKAALNTTSWLSAASFQETTRVLTEAAISRQGRPAARPQGERDHRQADPRRDRPRLLQEAARAGGPDPRRGADRPGDAVGLERLKQEGAAAALSYQFRWNKPPGLGYSHRYVHKGRPPWVALLVFRP